MEEKLQKRKENKEHHIKYIFYLCLNMKSGDEKKGGEMFSFFIFGIYKKKCIKIIDGLNYFHLFSYFCFPPFQGHF